MARPSEKISLFDFIGDKLPPEIKNAAVATKPAAVPSTTTYPSSTGGFNRAPSYGENRGNRFSGSHQEGSRGGNHRFDRENNNSRGNPRFNNTRPQQDFGHRAPPQPSSSALHQNSTHPRHENARGSHHQQQRNERNNHQERNGGAVNLARDMERMSVSNNSHSRQPHPQASSATGNHHQHQHHHRQQPQQLRNHQQNPHHKHEERFNNTAAFPTLDNTRRTPGFQNKESNEAAKKFLEQSDNQQPMLSQSGPHFKQNHRGPVANKLPATTVPQIPDTQSGGWNWKLGDRCMAKYWEDGKVRG